MEACTHGDGKEPSAPADGRCDDMEDSAAGCGVRLSVSVFWVRCVAESGTARVLRGDGIRRLLRVVEEQLGEAPQLYLLQVFRALLYVACVYPLLRMPQIVRWKNVLAIAAFLASWTTALLLPNPVMPESVARSHFWETLWFNLTFGALMAWLLGKSRPGAESVSIV